MLCIAPNSSITGTSPSDCVGSYPGHSLGWVLPLWRGAVSVFYSLSQLGKNWNERTHWLSNFVNCRSSWLDIRLDFNPPIQRILLNALLGYKINVSWFRFSLILWHVNHCRLFNTKSIFIHINCYISNNTV